MYGCPENFVFLMIKDLADISSRLIHFNEAISVCVGRQGFLAFSFPKYIK